MQGAVVTNPVAALHGVRSLSYRAEIGRASPTANVMAMDPSASINHRLNSGQSKAAFPADVLNETLYKLITSCPKAEGVRLLLRGGGRLWEPRPAGGAGGDKTAASSHASTRPEAIRIPCY